MAAATRTRRRHRPQEYLVTAVETLIVLAALAYLVTGAVIALALWEATATMYLVGGFVLARRRSLAGRDEPGRTGVLDTMSWILPFAASLVGIYSAILLLVNRAAEESTRAGDVTFAIAASWAIIVSWHLLHSGFAQMYEAAQDLDPQAPGLVFPRKPTPTLADFLYFSFTIGTAFATSDTIVATTRMRWTVLIHSVLSFFYNALVVATAFEIIQQLAR